MKWELNQYKLHGKNIKPIQNPCRWSQMDFHCGTGLSWPLTPPLFHPWPATANQEGGPAHMLAQQWGRPGEQRNERTQNCSALAAAGWLCSPWKLAAVGVMKRRNFSSCLRNPKPKQCLRPSFHPQQQRCSPVGQQYSPEQPCMHSQAASSRCHVQGFTMEKGNSHPSAPSFVNTQPPSAPLAAYPYGSKCTSGRWPV